jgi:adenylosuccinate lyase
MRGIFDRERWLEKALQVEAALAQAQAEVGDIPKEAAAHIRGRASTRFVKLERVDEIEKEIGHELMAVVKAFAEACGPYGGYIHVGATSNDVTDCILALQLREALLIVKKDLIDLARVLTDKAEEYGNLICLGRTHGMAALPMPFGFKFANWASEVKRHLVRLEQSFGRICVGKMSGAIGTMAGFGPKGREVQRRVMEILGIKHAEISTQVVARDGLAEFACLVGLISSTLDKIANEIRNLQRTEIGEVEEPFKEVQVGSSTMAHKRNPVRCEKVCGLARVIRGHVATALENVVLEHERDLTNSSYERAVIPELCLLLDEQLKTMKFVLGNLKVYPENMKRNIERTKGLIMSEAVIMALVRKGVDRQRAHELVRRCAMKAWSEKTTLENTLMKETNVLRYLTKEELKSALNVDRYLGTAREQIDEVVREVRSYLSKV